MPTKEGKKTGNKLIQWMAAEAKKVKNTKVKILLI